MTIFLYIFVLGILLLAVGMLAIKIERKRIVFDVGLVAIGSAAVSFGFIGILTSLKTGLIILLFPSIIIGALGATTSFYAMIKEVPEYVKNR